MKAKSLTSIIIVHHSYIDTPIAEYSCAKPIPANESREIKTSIMGTTTVGIDITPKLS